MLKLYAPGWTPVAGSTHKLSNDDLSFVNADGEICQLSIEDVVKACVVNSPNNYSSKYGDAKSVAFVMKSDMTTYMSLDADSASHLVEGDILDINKCYVRQLQRGDKRCEKLRYMDLPIEHIEGKPNEPKASASAAPAVVEAVKPAENVASNDVEERLAKLENNIGTITDMMSKLMQMMQK